MAISYDGNPYIHSNFFNFTGKAFNNFNFSENNKQPSSAIQDKIQALQGIKNKLEQETKAFLGRYGTIEELLEKTHQTGDKNIDDLYIQFRRVSLNILNNYAFYDDIKDKLQKRVSLEQFEELLGENLEQNVYSSLDKGETITLKEASSILVKQRINEIEFSNKASYTKQFEKLAKNFPEDIRKSFLKNVKNDFNKRYRTSSGKITKDAYNLLNKQFKDSFPEEDLGKTAKIISNVFTRYFNQETNSIVKDDDKSKKIRKEYLEAVNKIIMSEVPKGRKTGGSTYNLYGIGGEDLTVAIESVGNNILDFTLIGNYNYDSKEFDDFLKNRLASKISNLKEKDNYKDYSLKRNGPIYGDILITNKETNKTAIVQSKNWQGLKEEFISWKGENSSSEDPFYQRINILGRGGKGISFPELLDLIAGEEKILASFKLEELKYILANEAWFNKYGSYKRGKVAKTTAHQNILSAALSDIILNYLGLMFDKNLNVIPEISVLFYYINNIKYVPTYEIIDSLIENLKNFKNGLDKHFATTFTVERAGIPHPKTLYEQKALALAEKGKTFETPGLYKDEELLKVGSKQGAAILNNLKIKTIKFNVDLNTLLTSAYPFN